MCSTTAARLAEIRKAIDDLAAEAVRAGYSRQSGRSAADRSSPDATQTLAGTGGAEPAREPGATDPAPEPAAETSRQPRPAGTDIARLAELWAMLADIDPEISRRLPRYEL